MEDLYLLSRIFPLYQPQSDVHPPNLAVPGIEGGPDSPQTVASSKRPRERRDWMHTETSLLWELYETAYSLGKLTSKTTNNGKTLTRISIGN